MERWQGKVAVVTGASSGIGLVTAKALLREGLIVVGFARRKEKMESEIKSDNNSSNFYARECDVTDEKSIKENFQWVQNTFGKLNVLINNAGVIKRSRIEDTPVSDLDYVFKVNVLGVLHCAKEAIPLMKKITDCEAHIININSVLGHKVPNMDGYSVYPASKFAVRAMSESLNLELQRTKIRISSVSPGLVKSEMSQSALEACPTLPALEAVDLANTIVYILATPAHVEIIDIILQAKTRV